jgi:hypothetical protein
MVDLMVGLSLSVIEIDFVTIKPIHSTRMLKIYASGRVAIFSNEPIKA